MITTMIIVILICVYVVACFTCASIMTDSGIEFGMVPLLICFTPIVNIYIVIKYMPKIAIRDIFKKLEESKKK